MKSGGVSLHLCSIVSVQLLHVNMATDCVNSRHHSRSARCRTKQTKSTGYSYRRMFKSVIIIELINVEEFFNKIPVTLLTVRCRIGTVQQRHRGDARLPTEHLLARLLEVHQSGVFICKWWPAKKQDNINCIHCLLYG